jgi:UDP-N-acetylmuramoyl-L-alanyl-D-glutamate--2,6-diaminopimelate ligase
VLADLRPAGLQGRPLAQLAELLGVGPRGPGDPLTVSGGTVSGGTVSGGTVSGGTVSGVTHDSRRVRPGDLYAALPGGQHHGAEFCQDAARAGAVAVLTDPGGQAAAERCGLPVLVVADPRARLGEVADWVYRHPSGRLLLIGVTGTSGKTTTTYLLETGLRRAGHLTGLAGGVETRVGDLTTVSRLTTPEATDLQALFAVMASRGVTAAAMEVSSHALALGRVAGTAYDVAIFTNLSQDHLDFHGSLDEYFAAKATLFTPAYTRVGVVNTDDAYGRRLADSARIPVTTISAGGDPAADWRAIDVRTGADGSTFRIVGPGGVEADASVALPGRYNVANALGAVVALVEAGVHLATAVAGVAACPGVPGRLERVEAGQDFTLLVDYSHKPGAVEAVLGALRPVTGGRLCIVLGCGGDRDRAKRPLMGAASARLADVAILTSDNPRSEDPLAILAEMLAGVLTVPEQERARVIIEPDRAAAIGLAVAMAGKGDVVVVAGKGHERGQYVGDSVIPFDDREVAAAAIMKHLGQAPPGGVPPGGEPLPWEVQP